MTTSTIAGRSAGTSRWLGGLKDPARSIGGSGFDFMCFWGAPAIAFAAVALLASLAALMPKNVGASINGFLVLASALLTFAHLVAVAPRAYLNREVFQAYRWRLTVVPPLLLAGLVFSPTLLVLGAVIGVFWDIHHSALQNFGLGRIYDAKAGNDSQVLRSTDLGLNWFLYVGPLLAGASLMGHVDILTKLDNTSLDQLARLPGILGGELGTLKVIGVAGWVAALLWAAFQYRRAMQAGYRMPVHKAVLLISTGVVSVLAWGFSSPLVAVVSINIYHAVQYFALVWLKEGARMGMRAGRWRHLALPLFLGACVLIAVLNEIVLTLGATVLLAPFTACSLLHFWYDGFVWSVRRKHV